MKEGGIRGGTQGKYIVCVFEVSARQMSSVVRRLSEELFSLEYELLKSIIIRD